MKNYLTVLEESLIKKIEVLEKIKKATFAQKDLLSEKDLDLTAFDSYVDEKDAYISELTKLDEGFDTLYKRVSSELEANKAAYSEEIARLKELVTKVTELSSAIEAQEARNRDAVTRYFAGAKKRIATGRKSNKAALDYYKSAIGYNGDNSGMMDQKK